MVVTVLDVHTLALEPHEQNEQHRAVQWHAAHRVLPYHVKTLLRLAVDEAANDRSLCCMHFSFLVPYSKSVVGRELVSWLMDRGFSVDRAEGTRMGQSMVAAGHLRHVHDNQGFVANERQLYRFSSTKTASKPPTVLSLVDRTACMGWLTHKGLSFYFAVLPNENVLLRFSNDIGTALERLDLTELVAVNSDAEASMELRFAGDQSPLHFTCTDAAQCRAWCNTLRTELDGKAAPVLSDGFHDL